MAKVYTICNTSTYADTTTICGWSGYEYTYLISANIGGDIVEQNYNTDTEITTVSTRLANPNTLELLGNGSVIATFTSARVFASAGTSTISGTNISVQVGTLNYVTVTNTLNHLSNSNTATTCLYGGSYTGTLTADSGYSLADANVRILMGNTDITSTAYNSQSGNIVISNVTDSIYIQGTILTQSTLTIKDSLGTSTLGTLTFFNITSMTLSRVGSRVTLSVVDNGTTKSVSWSVTVPTGYDYLGLGRSPRSSTAFINVNQTTEVTLTGDITMYDVIVEHSVEPTTFDIKLYRNSAENNKVDKTSQLSLVSTLTGTLRESCSITNPVIKIYYSGLPTFNYVYIARFNRYYFVKSITSLINNLWEISLHVDVLMSYRLQMLNLTALVSRNENDYNLDLKDDRLVAENDFTFTTVEVPNSVLSTSSDTGNNYIFTVVN